MSYPKTWILLVTDGSQGDITAASNASRLKWKGQMDPVYGCVGPDATSDRRLLGNRPSAFLDGDASELRHLTGQDRLYVVGHGSFGASPVLGGLDAGQLAQYLFDSGLREVAVISLVSCNSGWGWGDMLPGSIPKGYANATQHPFGHLLADELSSLGIHAAIRARVGYVTVMKTGRKVVEFTEMSFVNKFIWAPKGYNKRTWYS